MIPQSSSHTRVHPPRRCGLPLSARLLSAVLIDGSHMTKWKPLSVREGRRETTGPYDGVPTHLQPHLLKWLRTAFSSPDMYIMEGFSLNDQVLERVVLTLEIHTMSSWGNEQTLEQIFRYCRENEDQFLDVIDLVINLQTSFMSNTGAAARIGRLRQLLLVGGSVWTVDRDSLGLVRAVNQTAVKEYEDVTQADDVASDEMSQAWRHAYGLRPNASAAWHHTIKAVEALLIPLVIPNKDKPNLGGVAGTLHAQPENWRFALQPSDGIGGLATFEAMLRLIWPNPDRHGSESLRAPTDAEARAVVHAGITVMQWTRSGALTPIVRVS